MTAFTSNLGPLANGLKPKAYFAGTRAILRSKLRHAEVVPAQYDKFERVPSVESVSDDPYSKELWAIAPWIGFVALLIINFMR
jgi:hypothetical protein